MISLKEIAKSINEDPRGVDNIDRSKGAEKKDQDADRVGRDDGETWMAPNGDYGGKHNGEIQYFDDEDSAKVYAKSGSTDSKGGEEKPEEPKGNIGKGDFERDFDDKGDEPKDEPKGDKPDLDTQYKDALKKANDLANSQYDNQGNPAQGASNKQVNLAFKKAKDLEDEIRFRDKKAKEKEDEPEKKKGFFSKMFGKKESISINGKKYKAVKEDRADGKKLVGYSFAGKIYKKKSDAPVSDPRPVYESKESKKHPLKETYDRTFRSLK